MILIYVPAGSDEEAQRLARSLVAEKLVACANLLPIRSVYRWEGELREEGEVLVLMKTRDDLYPRCAARIRELHSYDVPCIAAYRAAEVNDDYLSWVRAETEAVS